MDNFLLINLLSLFKASIFQTSTHNQKHKTCKKAQCLPFLLYAVSSNLHIERFQWKKWSLYGISWGCPCMLTPKVVECGLQGWWLQIWTRMMNAQHLSEMQCCPTNHCTRVMSWMISIWHSNWLKGPYNSMPIMIIHNNMTSNFISGCHWCQPKQH